MADAGALGGGEAAPEGTQETQEQQAPERDSGVSQLSEKFDQFLGDFQSRLEQMESRLTPAQEEQQEEEAPFTPDEFFQEDGSITPEDLQQWIDQAAEKKAQQFTQPIQQQWAESQAKAEEQRLERAADALEEKYPILGDEEYLERFVETAQQQAMALAQSMGDPELAEILWKQPEFMENIHLAIQARERAENEVPAGSESGFQLERGGSIGPMGAVDDDEAIRNRIIHAKG